MLIQSVEYGILKGIQCFKLGKFNDIRGFFAELYHLEELKKVGLSATFIQDNISRSQKGVLRGMHYQVEPHGIGKLICCITGAIYDVVVDLRKGSPTFGQWEGFYLTEDLLVLLWVPVGFAHGFLSLCDNTHILYKCTAFHNAEAERSLSYCCPKVNIQWPEEPLIISEKDKNAPPLEKAEYNFIYKEE